MNCPLTASSALSATDSSGTMDWRRRSFGTSANPEAMEELGEDSFATLPRTVTRPVDFVIPYSASITSGAPSPGRLAMPTTS